MSLPEEEFAERRRRLAAQIARQRAEFSVAYAKLEQPIRFADYGLRGFGFFRSNPWVFAAVPAAIGIIKTLRSGAAAKKKSSSASSFRQTQEGAPGSTGLGRTAATWAGRGWRLFQLYRRIRSYLP